MSALAIFNCSVSATDSTERAGGLDLVGSVRTVNMLMDVLSDVNLYESKDEPKPSGWAILAAADALVHVDVQDQKNVEVEPYSGELSLIWRAGRDKRVKAMFGQEKGSYSVYHERMVDGKVVEHHLEPNAGRAYLQRRLAWLRE